MTLKKVIRYIHLWLGLTSGVIIFIIAITGCLYAFQAEIENRIQGPYKYVTSQQAAYLPPTQIKCIAEKELPGKHPQSVEYGKRNEAARVLFYGGDPQYYYVIFINPYTGRVLKVKNMNRDFFRIVLDGHYYLWLPPAIGQPIVITATVVFVAMMMTGLILWWPKNKAAAKQRFTIKWSAAWRRRNYDLHNVLGFYMTWIVIFMAITGLVFGWQWFANVVYRTAGGQKTLTYQEPVSDTSKTTQLTGLSAVDTLWLQMQAQQAGAAIVEIHFPATPKGVVEVAINPDGYTYWKTDYLYFDQYTLKELPVKHIYGRFKNTTAADKLLRMNYDIHTGAILGFPGKLLAFFTSLIAASLPVTGFLIWWGRRKKKKTTPGLQPVKAATIGLT